MKRGIILLSTILLIGLVSAQYLFSLDVDVKPKVISLGEDIIVNTNIKSLGISSDRVDILVSYEIIGEDGELINKSERMIDIRSSTIAIQTSLSTSEIFKLPEDIKPGNHKIIVKVNYQGEETSASDSFRVTENTFFDKLNKLVNNNQIILVIIALLILIISIWRIIHHYHTHYKKSHR